MISSRTGALAAALLAVVGAGAASAVGWPSSEDALSCAPSEVRLFRDARDGSAIAACAPGGGGAALHPAQALALGLKLDLNRASAQDLERVPGIGPKLARAIVSERARLGGFRSWEEVDGVPGVGPAKAEALRAVAELRP